MTSLSIFTLKVLRKLYAKTFGGYQLPPLQREEDPDKASEMIYNLLSDDKPCMIARFGANELNAVINYLGVNAKKHSIWKFIQGEQPEWWWNKNIMYHMQNNAGFFPASPENMQRFGEMIINDMKYLDVLESWLPSEVILKDFFHHCSPVTAKIMEPFFLEHPWTKVLEGKKILVVHPFAESISSQYKKREFLFDNPDILPEFDLQTIKAIQSIGGNDKYADWFVALNDMKKQINSADYDICIIGCGAYGFPLAAHVKRMGKKAIHLASLTQLLFGIMGARWNNDHYSKENNYKELANSYWVRPSAAEKPQNASNVEGGCYW